MMHLIQRSLILILLFGHPMLFAQTIDQIDSQSSIKIQGDHQHKYAIFWSNLNTWIVDITEQRIYFSNHLYGKANHLLFEYILSTQSQRRPRVNHPYGWIYRWVSLERQLLQSEFVDQLTYHFLENEVEGDFFDEHRILQFTNETVTLGRWVEQNREDEKKSSFFRLATAYTIDLSTREKLRASDFSEEKGKWLHQHFPKQFPACLSSQEDGVRFEIPGRREVLYDVFSSKLSQKKSCTQDLILMRREQQKPKSFFTADQQLIWQGQKIWYQGKLISDQVADALLHPSGQYAIILEGKNLDAEEQMIVKINDLEDIKPRFLAIWHKDQPDQVLRFHQTDLISRLDGARWIAQDDLFLDLLDHRFKTLEQVDCFQSLKVFTQSKKAKKPSRYSDFIKKNKDLPFQQNLCAITGNSQYWKDKSDLSARIISREINQTLRLEIEVLDQDVNQQDLLYLWFASQSYPYVIQISQNQLYSNLSSHAQPKNETLLEYQWEKTEKGYFVSLILPYQWLDQKMAVAIQDHDQNDQEDLFLWLSGLGVEFQQQLGLEEGEKEINSQDEVPMVDMPFEFSIEHEEEQFNALSVKLKSFRQYSEKDQKKNNDDEQILEVDPNVISLSALNEKLKKLDENKPTNKPTKNPSTFKKTLIPLPQLMPIVEEMEKSDE